jgi:hypothetical protein
LSLSNNADLAAFAKALTPCGSLTPLKNYLRYATANKQNRAYIGTFSQTAILLPIVALTVGLVVVIINSSTSTVIIIFEFDIL